MEARVSMRQSWSETVCAGSVESEAIVPARQRRMQMRLLAQSTWSVWMLGQQRG